MGRCRVWGLWGGERTSVSFHQEDFLLASGTGVMDCSDLLGSKGQTAVGPVGESGGKQRILVQARYYLAE